MSIKTKIEWFTLEEKLPEIPEGSYAVEVLVQQRESCSVNYSYIQTVMYGNTADRHGVKTSPYVDSDKEFDFQEQLTGLYPDTDWVPVFDEIEYWAYLPEVIKIPKFKVDRSSTTTHVLYKTGDIDAPSAILDRNGEVVLDACRVCGQAESTLVPICPGYKK